MTQNKEVIMEREEGGKILPFKNRVTDGDTSVLPHSEGRFKLYTTDHFLLAEIIRGLEYLSQQIYEKG